MKIAFEVTDEEFDGGTQTLYLSNLGIAEPKLKTALSDIARTAFLEYLGMICGQGIPDKAAEVRQNRLEYLIKYYYKDKMPKESEIQTIFQMSATQSKTLLKNTRSKKRTAIEEQIKKTIIAVLSAATLVRDKYRLTIKSENVLQEMNEMISEKGPGLYKIQAVKNMASTFECPKDTMALLKSEYGIP